MQFDSAPHTHTFASVLGWQSRVRIVVALIYAAATMTLQSVGMLLGSVVSIALTLVGYIAVTALTTLWAKRSRTALAIPVAIAITADIAFLFAVTGVTSSPGVFRPRADSVVLHRAHVRDLLRPRARHARADRLGAGLRRARGDRDQRRRDDRLR